MKIEKDKKSKKIKSEISLLKLLKAGAHFGHSKEKRHPKMKPYIYDLRNGVHIIDLEKTLKKLNQAIGFIQEIIQNKGQILFIGTKSQARDIIKQTAQKDQMPYVNERWLGGTFTNFQTISKQINKLKDLEEKQASGELKKYTKKEQGVLKQEITRLNKLLGGLKIMQELPQAVFVIDVEKERITVQEARKKNIPIIALADTNIDPSEIDYPIPCNDDAIKVIKIMCEIISDAIIKYAGKN